MFYSVRANISGSFSLFITRRVYGAACQYRVGSFRTAELANSVGIFLTKG
jgi:hypothetical protein